MTIKVSFGRFGVQRFALSNCGEYGWQWVGVGGSVLSLGGVWYARTAGQAVADMQAVYRGRYEELRAAA
jgi:hypothetical protein